MWARDGDSIVNLVQISSYLERRSYAEKRGILREVQGSHWPTHALRAILPNSVSWTERRECTKCQTHYLSL